MSVWIKNLRFATSDGDMEEKVNEVIKDLEHKGYSIKAVNGPLLIEDLNQLGLTIVYEVKPWTCVWCDAENDGSEPYCYECNTSNQFTKSDLEAWLEGETWWAEQNKNDQSIWECPNCRMYNEGKQDYCSACNQPKP